MGFFDVKKYFFNENNSFSMAFHVNIWEKNMCFKVGKYYMVKNNVFYAQWKI